MLQHLLDDANSEKERLRNLYLEVREQNLTFRSQLDAMAQEGVTTEYSPYHHFRSVPVAYPESSSQRFLKIREMLRDCQGESRDTKRKLALLELDLLRGKTDLATAKRDGKCNLLPPEGHKSLWGLPSANILLAALLPQADLHGIDDLHENELLPELLALRKEREELYFRQNGSLATIGQLEGINSQAVLEMDQLQAELSRHRGIIRAVEQSGYDLASILDVHDTDQAENTSTQAAHEEAQGTQAAHEEAQERPATEAEQSRSEIAERDEVYTPSLIPAALRISKETSTNDFTTGQSERTPKLILPQIIQQLEDRIRQLEEARPAASAPSPSNDQVFIQFYWDPVLRQPYPVR